MAGGPLSETLRWFEDQSAGAPEPLRDRARQFAMHVAAEPHGARLLGRAARDALGAALTHSSDRAAALDLLAADALITLALLWQAESEPGRLAGFAAELRREGSAVR